MATITTKETKSFDWATFNRAELKVGDEISEVLKNGEKVVFVVVDDGVIGLKDCLAEEHYMNKEWTNEGGWLKCDMRRYLNEEVLALLPDDLQAIIKPRTFGSEQDKLWLFSEVEIFGERDLTEKEDDRDKQLEYFKNPVNRVKRDKDGDVTCWRERLPNAYNSAHFCLVSSNGSADGNIAGYARGVCFGLYI